MRWAVTFVAVVNFALFGCGRHWPTVQGVADPGFARHQVPIESVDLLPIDVDFAISAEATAPAEQILDRFQASAIGTISAELSRRGYRLRAAMDWQGNYVDADGSDAVAGEQEVIVETSDSLRGYGYAQSRTHDGLLFPYLPYRLGELTGSDTTLYVGGWAFVGKKRTSTGVKVAKGVLIGAVVVVVIVAAIAGLKKGGGALGSGAAHVAKVAGHGAKIVVRTAGRAAGAMGKAAEASGRVLAKTGARALETTARMTARTTARAIDAFGRSDTHIDVYGGDPEYYEREVPRRGYSRMEIEMTLIDNATGRTLWHARQRFEADAGNARDTSEVMRRMLASLPPR